MPTLKFLGGESTAPTSVSIRSYIQDLLAGNLTQSEVNDLIAARLSAYATKTYTDGRDALLADSAFIDAADASRLSRSSLNVPGYPFTLDGNGKIPASRIKVSGMQYYPFTTAAPAGGSATTASTATLQNISIPDPGYPYRILVFGTVHGSVATDAGGRPIIEVMRGNTRVGYGYGIAESYQMPAVGSVGSRMYAGAYRPPITGFPFANGKMTTGWMDLAWTGVDSADYSTTLSGKYMQIKATMKGVAITAQMAWSGGVKPADLITPGKLIVEARLFSEKLGVLASDQSTNMSSGQFNFAVTKDVTEADMLTVQVKQTLESPTGFTDFWSAPGNFATWAPDGTGTSNAVTVTPPLAPGVSGGEIVVLPVSHSAFTGASSVVAYLIGNGTSVSALPAPTARMSAIPIPA